MAKPNSRQRAEAEKARRQKVLLALLSPVLIVILVIQVPKLMKSQSVASPRVVEEASTTPVVGLPGPSATTSTDPTAKPGELAGEAFFTAAPGQLKDLDRFASRDPFGQIKVPDTAPAGGSSGQGGSSSGGSGGSGSGSGGSGGSTGEPAPYISAVISVNGIRETVAMNATFPSAAPVFVLKSISATSVKIAIWGGSFSSGAATITLKRGEKLTLQNAADGSQYVLLLVSVSKQSADVASPSVTTGATTPDGPTSTNTTGTSTASDPPPPVPPSAVS